MIWDHFVYFAIVAILLWMMGALSAWKHCRIAAIAATSLGLCVFLAFVCLLWHHLERPPLRTMGETRLWYSLFLPLVGLIIYSRWKYQWILSFSTLLATVFIVINLLKPEIHSKTLMPALQSPWFAPHVIVYMFAYALLGASAVMAAYLLLVKHKANQVETAICDNLVGVGLSFMTVGMLFGALWAKEAWGHYWAWDPKETWAAVTWFAYLVYVHARRLPKANNKGLLVWLIVAFALLQMCWWGINYLPSAQATSVHTYNIGG